MIQNKSSLSESRRIDNFCKRLSLGSAMRHQRSSNRNDQSDRGASMVSSIESERNTSMRDKPSSKKASQKILAEKLDRDLMFALAEVLHCDATEIQTMRLNQDQLYKVLDTMGFLNTKKSGNVEQAKNLVSMVWIQLSSASISSKDASIGYADVKQAVFCAYDIWEPKWMSKLFSQQEESSEGTTQSFKFENKAEFDLFHKRVKVFQANKGQNDYHLRKEDLQERTMKFDYDFRANKSARLVEDSFKFQSQPQGAKNISSSKVMTPAGNSTHSMSPMKGDMLRQALSPGGQQSQQQSGDYCFKPKINRKSELMDMKHNQNSEDRATLILKKGREYQEKVEKKRQEQTTLDRGDFMPKVNKHPVKREQQVFMQLYRDGLKLKQGRKGDRAKVEIEFEKQVSECTFKPKQIATKNQIQVYSFTGN